VVLVAALGLVGAACTSAPGSAVHDPYVSTSPPKLAGGPSDEITVGTVDGLGTVLVDGEGLTVYMFESDHRGRPSICVGLCAVGWPPLTLTPGTDAPIAGKGIVDGLLGTAPRADGTTQITYDGWPLYTWPQDTRPGQATGQALTNLGGRWYVLRPDGTVVKTAGAGP
jgi:predicted lipoprotein with Yx(FWY)xxD motif